MQQYMKRLRIFYLIWVVFICNTVLAQSQSELGQLMRERGEYYFTLDVSDPSEIQAISKICSVDGTNGRTVVAYANQREYDKLLADEPAPIDYLNAGYCQWLKGNTRKAVEAFRTFLKQQQEAGQQVDLFDEMRKDQALLSAYSISDLDMGIMCDVVAD